MDISAQDAQKLKLAIQSMRQFNRAELKEARTGASLVDLFYEDPYVSGHLLSELKSERHTFIVGRRGSGKSTSFQKARLDLRTTPGVLTAYVNLKSVNISANDSKIELPEGKSGRHAKQILWFRGFIKHLLKELSGDLRKKNSEGFFRILTGRKEQAARELKKLEQENRYLGKLDLDAQVPSTVDIGTVNRTETSIGTKLGFTDGSVSAGKSKEQISSDNITLRGTRYNIFEVHDFVFDLRKILEHLGVKRLYLFLDDYSELDDAAMGFLMDEVVHPLATVSEDFLTFKIAAYPNRLYTGKLDRATFDVLRSDFADVYTFNPTGTIEQRGAQFIERVLKKRLDYYTGRSISHFFALTSHPPLFELLFQASFANIRSLGNLLQHAYTDTTAHHKRITIASVEAAARKNFEESIGRNLRQFGEATNTRQKLGRLQMIVDHAKSLSTATGITAGDSRAIKKVYASHFYVEKSSVSLLDDLTHSKAVHHYTDTRTADGRDVSIFAIDLGQCLLEGILFGRPPEARTSAYFTQPQFDLTAKLEANETMASAAGTPIVASRPQFGQQLGTAFTALDGMSDTHRRILDAIYEAGPRVSLLARQIAGAVDLSPAIVGKAAAELNKNGLIVRERSGAVYSYKLSDKGRAEISRQISAPL